MGNYELNQVRDSFDPPSPRTQTDWSDAVPRLAGATVYWPILNSSDLAYKLYPINLRPPPSAENEPIGLIQDTRFRPADTVRLPMTIPRGFLTTQIVTPPAWSTMMY